MRSPGACAIVLLLGAFLTSSDGYGEEPRSRGAVEVSREARAALAASIPRREAELAMRQREEVLAEVEARAEEMGVQAPAEELTELLGRRAHLEIALDKCRLGNGRCRTLELSLAAVEAEFRKKADLSTREFRSGRRETPGDAPGDTKVRFEASTYYTCTCTFTVYSSNRWMNPYWALECNNHASHGFCSNNVDSGHSAGSGSMTGYLNVYFGPNHIESVCPDDHYTCFRGPSADHPGAWGNTCSCDTWHSQYYNPWVSWYGGALSDAVEVAQISTPPLSKDGVCDGSSVFIREHINENDPVCCDDPMGDLEVPLPISEGVGSVSGDDLAQNCNGGSQSGVYPNCGTFGATIRVAYNCQTTEFTPEYGTSCRETCFTTPPDWLCSCEPGCMTRGDCCSDFQSRCCHPDSPHNTCV